MSFEPFYVGTCEANINDGARIPFTYPIGSPLAPFEISDPFGLRSAVVPVFRRDPHGRVYGMGTAFHFDGWGGFITADHVIDFSRESLPGGGLDPAKVATLNPAQENHAVLLLSMGLIFGTVGVLPWAMAPVETIFSISAENENPMAMFGGEPPRKVVADLARLQTKFQPDVKVHPSTLPVRINGWRPKVGEHVLAIGYPQLDCTEVAGNELRSLIAEGMRGAYGVITDVFPEGRGTTNPTPVFEVEAEWPSGMSGGPVFNRQGDVVGVVSRSLLPNESERGVGYAACLPLIAPLQGLLRTLDPFNPGRRLGYGVVREFPWHLASVETSMPAAQQVATSLGNGFRVLFGSHRIGTNEFVW